MKKSFLILITILMLVLPTGCSGSEDSSTVSSFAPEATTESGTDNSSTAEAASTSDDTGTHESHTTDPNDLTSSAIDGNSTGTTSTGNSSGNSTSGTTSKPGTNTSQPPTSTTTPNPPATQVTLSIDKSAITIEVGKTDTIKATVSPSGTAVTWTSGDNGIATVNNGTVTGKSAGTTVIIVKAGGQEKRCTVTVKQPAAAPFDASPYASYAISEGQKLGLIHNEAYVSKGNWNPWINLSSKLTDAQMKQNIRDSLKIMVNEGREYFFVYLEKQPDNSYHLFIYFG